MAKLDELYDADTASDLFMEVQMKVTTFMKKNMAMKVIDGLLITKQNIFQHTFW